MNLRKCASGHFYDRDIHQHCPHCESAASDISEDRKGQTVEKHSQVLQKYESCKNMDEPFIFVSYAHADAQLVKPFFDVLENNHFRYWYDEGLPSGVDFYYQIARHIKCAVQFIVFVSEKSQRSENVKDEIHVAYKHKKKMLVVYIEDICQLDDGLELALDRKQNLRAYEFSQEDADRRFYNELSKDALKPIEKRSYDIVCSDSQSEQVFLSKYNDIRLHAKTSLSDVYVAVQKSTGNDVIIKKTVFDSNHNGDYLRNCINNEKRALIHCRCPFLPQLIDVYETDEYAYIVQTLICGESPKVQCGYSERFVIDYALKIVHILKYLYYHGIVHCDIKPNNTLVNEMGDVFLVDFGSSFFIHENNVVDTPAGTFGFASPEQLTPSAKIDFRTDIYGLGRTMLSMLVGSKISSKNVFANRDSTEIITSCGMTSALNNTEVRVQYITESLDYYDSFASPLLCEIINRMISPQKENRYFSLDELSADLRKVLSEI